MAKKVTAPKVVIAPIVKEVIVKVDPEVKALKAEIAELKAEMEETVDYYERQLSRKG